LTAQPAQPPVIAVGMPHQFQLPDLFAAHLQILDRTCSAGRLPGDTDAG
jgi:hypothetical protein